MAWSVFRLDQCFLPTIFVTEWVCRYHGRYKATEQYSVRKFNQRDNISRLKSTESYISPMHFRYGFNLNPEDTLSYHPRCGGGTFHRQKYKKLAYNINAQWGIHDISVVLFGAAVSMTAKKAFSKVTIYIRVSIVEFKHTRHSFQPNL